MIKPTGLTIRNGNTITSKQLDVKYLEKLPSKYKERLGLRFISINSNKQRVYYGFDLFHLVSSHGLDLTNFLSFCDKHDFGIDWYNFTRTSLINNWTYDTLIRKIKYPIIDVYGKDYFIEEYYEQILDEPDDDWTKELIEKFKAYGIPLPE